MCFPQRKLLRHLTKEILKLPHIQRSYDYCEISFWVAKQGSKLPTKSAERFKRVEVIFSGVSDDLQTMGSSNLDLFA